MTNMYHVQYLKLLKVESSLVYFSLWSSFFLNNFVLSLPKDFIFFMDSVKSSFMKIKFSKAILLRLWSK